MNISPKIRALAAEAEASLAAKFSEFDAVARILTERVLDKFALHRVSTADISLATSGYGYGDVGRDKLDTIYAELFGAESGLVRHSIANGTHALTIALFGLLRPNDTLLSVTGAPYDTLKGVISGVSGEGSLRDFGVNYKQIDFKNGSEPDLEAVNAALADPSVKVVFVQRSKGYMSRPTLSVAQIGKIVKLVKTARSDVYVMVDNCYGEFSEEREPTAVGADLCVGSLIKNPGGGVAESGGYIVGERRAVELASYRLTSVGIGAEVGATLGQNKLIYRGLFNAPCAVAAAKKTAALAAYMFERLGFAVNPRYDSERGDIIQSVETGSAETLIAFCRGIQAASPIDSFAVPEPWPMPGYADNVIMAAGTFVSGASIELSADGPLRPPYTAFFQGGLTYESGRLGIMSAADEILRLKKEQ